MRFMYACAPCARSYEAADGGARRDATFMCSRNQLQPGALAKMLLIAPPNGRMYPDYVHTGRTETETETHDDDDAPHTAYIMQKRRRPGPAQPTGDEHPVRGL